MTEDAVIFNTELTVFRISSPSTETPSANPPPNSPSKGVAGPGSGLYQHWAGPLSDGVVIGLIASNGAQNFQVNFADVPGSGSGTYSNQELYSGKTGSGTSVSILLQSHDMAVDKVTKPRSFR